MQFFPSTPGKCQTIYVSLTKMGLAAWASMEFSKLTGGPINQFVVCLAFGVIAAETGFLERKPLIKNKSFGYMILSLMTYVLIQFPKSTPQMLAEIAGPLADSPGGYEFLMDRMLLKMLIGGFTSVTIVSVVLAGFFVKFL